MRNVRPATLLLLIPIGISFLTFAVIGAGLHDYWLARQSAKRLVTHDWQAAAQIMQDAQPSYGRKFAYYQIKPGQKLSEVASFFGVSVRSLEEDNKGSLFPGMTIKVRPIDRPLQPVRSTRTIAYATVAVDGDVLRIKNEYDLNAPIRTTIPELAERLSAYDAIDSRGNKTYRLNRAISIQGDIRVDVTSDTVHKLELASEPDGETLASLLFDKSAVLFKGVTVTTVDPATGKPDENSKDGRAFVRMKNGRMDVINSTFSWLGNGLTKDITGDARTSIAQREGGTYGFSYRVSKGKLGVELATGWVENSTFEHNHFGAFTFGTSGMMWRNNLFTHNEVYGLDPHDDSNNALVIGNRFLYNGKHGFIVSKRCNFNEIRNNTSVGNVLHGFMLHQDSAYNVIENNVAYDNEDNFVIFHSNWNTIRNNQSYVPRKSHVRINDSAHNNYITDNDFIGGHRGIYLYDGADTTYVAGNHLNEVHRPIQTKGADFTFFGDNEASSFNYDIATGDKFIFGKNGIDRGVDDIPARADVETGDFAS